MLVDMYRKRQKVYISRAICEQSQDLINNLFSHPYTKVEFVMRDLKVSRITATRYLDELTASGILRKRKVGRTNYYINEPLVAILTRV